MKKVLITGASGLLGRAILKEFSNSASWEVLGLAFSRSGDNLKKVDLTDNAAVRDTLKEFKPDVVVHSAAERRPDVVQNKPGDTKQLNVGATENIAKICGELNAFLVYISTDYVFDGTKPPYKPNDQPNPLNAYGQSKLDGEIVTLQCNPSAVVLRVPILYGQVEFLSESAVTILFNSVKDTSKPANMCNYQQRFPTHTRDVAVVIRQIAEKQSENPSIKGIYHWSNNEQVTKFAMATKMAEIFNLPRDHLKANEKAPPGAPRPKNAQLDTSDLDGLGIGQRTPFQEGIKEALEPYL
ncbi:methionine adenosyltransferase 2 subunit beta-like [Anneissia japonica]|uniref:methionine adenosyltransferase 2 subunit beta-like n=1 Tax=Anneissia japonica TaxID=1529436 RepID=UPI001425B30D|nr:methionine adenosyltransferase 2 subunit beta-like [Anneissia japonica]